MQPGRAMFSCRFPPGDGDVRACGMADSAASPAPRRAMPRRAMRDAARLFSPSLTPVLQVEVAWRDVSPRIFSPMSIPSVICARSRHRYSFPSAAADLSRSNAVCSPTHCRSAAPPRPFQMFIFHARRLPRTPLLLRGARPRRHFSAAAAFAFLSRETVELLPPTQRGLSDDAAQRAESAASRQQRQNGGSKPRMRQRWRRRHFSRDGGAQKMLTRQRCAFQSVEGAAL